MYRLVWQSIDEHQMAVARLAAMAIPSEFVELLREEIDVSETFLQGCMHDDPEKITGDVATNVDQVSSEEKRDGERQGIRMLYGMLRKKQMFIDIWQEYERRERYQTKLIKMCDWMELMLWLRMLQSNGVGLVKYAGEKIVVKVLGGGWQPLDVRAYLETEEYLKHSQTMETATIVCTSLLRRLKRQMADTPELIKIYEIVDLAARQFDFAKYNFKNLPPLWT